jgi:hypothetical protein
MWHVDLLLRPLQLQLPLLLCCLHSLLQVPLLHQHQLGVANALWLLRGDPCGAAVGQRGSHEPAWLLLRLLLACCLLLLAVLRHHLL